MAHFYSSIQGSRGEATRAGTKSSGIEAMVQTWTGRIESKMYHDELRGIDSGYVVLTTGPTGTGRTIDLTGDIEVSTLVQAVEFDPDTARHLRQARLSIQRANVAAVKAIARRDRLAQKAA